MIKLRLCDKPIELTDEVEKELVSLYKSTEKDVWNKTYIKDALFLMSNGKCAYSEQKLNERSSYLEVEHFRCKKHYPDSVVEWGNLLPSCKKCNTTKGELDVACQPIVNPLIDEPRDFLFVRGCRFYPKNEKGRITIDTVALNDRQHFVNPRFQQASFIVESLESELETLENYNQCSSVRIRTIINRIKGLFAECGHKKEFSAVIATFVVYEWPKYKELKNLLISLGCWDDEFVSLEADMLTVAMPE